MEMTRNNKKRPSNSNAFDLLMQKRPCVKKSRFVPCPAGCGSHVLEQNVNTHLDSCLGNRTDDGTLTRKQPVCDEKAQEEEQSETTTTSSTEGAATLKKAAVENPVAVGSCESGSPNVFAHMMKQSHRVFAVKEPLRQRFHLHLDGRLSWTNIMEDDPESLKDDKVQWSAKVLLKASRMMHGQEQTGPDAIVPRDVELTVSTSMASDDAASSRRLVQRHSRLSVSGSLSLDPAALIVSDTGSLETCAGSCSQVHFAKVCSTTSTTPCSARCYGVNGQGCGRAFATPTNYYS